MFYGVWSLGLTDVSPPAAHIDANLCWDDIAWIRARAPGVPIVVKGVGCVEDVELAAKYGADGVVLVRYCFCLRRNLFSRSPATLAGFSNLTTTFPCRARMEDDSSTEHEHP